MLHLCFIIFEITSFLVSAFATNFKFFLFLGKQSDTEHNVYANSVKNTYKNAGWWYNYRPKGILISVHNKNVNIFLII